MPEKNMKGRITVEFEEAASRQSLESGESINTLFGKIKKFFSDLKSVAFSGSYNDLSDKPEQSDIIPFVIGTQTAVTGTWTGDAPSVENLYDGLTIRYWLPYNGSRNATLNLTLKDGSTTDAVNCYYSGNTRITTQYLAGNVLTLTYRKNVSVSGSTTKYTGWWADANYDSNTYDRIRYYKDIKCGDADILGGNIIVGINGVYTHLKSGNAFDITYPILYASSNISASAMATTNYLCMPFNINTTQSMTLTFGKPIFIKGNLSGAEFTPISTTPLTQDIPESDDGYEYILLGMAYSTTGCYLLSEHPIYAFVNGKFSRINGNEISEISAEGNVVTYKRVDGTTGSFETQDKNVTSTKTYPDSTKIYFPTMVEKSGNSEVSINDGFRYQAQNGTTDIDGVAELLLGTNTASETAGNMYGRLRLYSNGQYAGIIKQDLVDSNIIHTLPNMGGYILNTGTTSFEQTQTSGFELGVIKINGEEKKIYSPENANTVTGTLANPATTNTFYIPFHNSASTGTKYLKNNDGLGYITVNGTASVEGSSFLRLGNATKNGTAGNKTGKIRLYGNSSGYTDIVPSYSGANKATVTLPSYTGVAPVVNDCYACGDIYVDKIRFTPKTAAETSLSYSSDDSTLRLYHAGSACEIKSAVAFLRIEASSTEKGRVYTEAQLAVPYAYNNTVSGGSPLYIDSSGVIGKSSSSRRTKTNINYDIDKDKYHNVLMNMRSVEFEYKNNIGTVELGMIAEDVEKLSPIAALYEYASIYNNKKQCIGKKLTGRVDNYKDRAIIQMLVMEAQRKDKEIRLLNEKVERLNIYFGGKTNE